MSRLPRFERAHTVTPIQLTERDYDILRLIHRHRFLRSHQIIDLIGGSPQQLSRRLQRLFHHGYLERPRAQLQYYERSGSQTIAYGLGNKSGPLLNLNPASWGEKNRAIGRMYLAHGLLVSDVMVSLELACRRHGIRLLSEDELNLPVEAPMHWRVRMRDGTKLGVIPDRTFALEYSDQKGQVQRVYYFLEADRGTMPVVREKLAQPHTPLEERRKQLEAEIPRLEAQVDILNVNTLSAAEIASQASNLYDHWQTMQSEEKRGIIEIITNKIIIAKNEITLNLTYSPSCKDMANRWRKGRDLNPR